MRALRWVGRFWTGVLAVVVLVAALLLGLRLLLPLISFAPAVIASSPPDGAGSVPPRDPLTLHFNRPMNPRSVQRAIIFDPDVGWAPGWSDDFATLTISPTQGFRPDTSYRLTISGAALSRRFRPLDAPIELRFRTATAPAVVQMLPADAAVAVPVDSPISITFSRPIVPSTALMQPRALPELRFDPPIDGAVTWLDQATVLFRPAESLRPGMRYRATLAADLTDIAGGPLGRPFSWSFSTPAPSVLASWPADGARGVAPSATLALTLSQPLTLDSVRATMSISPTLAGTLATKDLPDGRQVMTFAPTGGWQPGTTYHATLAAGATPVAGNLPLITATSWNFTIAPRPALIARFPGDGQTLPQGQPISLVFNSAMDPAAFRALVRFDPPAGDVGVSTIGSEVRIAADLRAATVYTMTLPAELTDRNGIPIGQERQIRLLTAPASPSLVLPEATAHLAQVAAGQPADLLIQRTNLTSLSFDLYQLDEDTTVRALGFGESDWVSFQPERYGQSLLRSWRVPLADPLNRSTEDRVPLAADANAALPAGAYYLRLRALEGPRADLLVLVARTRLTLQMSSAEALIWVTDSGSGTPARDLPIALYQGGALIQRGLTDSSGVARFARVGGSAASYVALADSAPPPPDASAALSGAAAARPGQARQARFGVVSGAWGEAAIAPREGRRLFVTTDRAVYRPGERVRLAGFARATSALSGTLGLPREDEIALMVRPLDAGSRIYQGTVDLGASGVFSDAFTLGQSARGGEYLVVAMIGGDLAYTRFVIIPDVPVSLQVAVRTPPPLVAGAPAPLTIEVRTPEGLPVASATISWTLGAAPAPLPDVGDYVFGDDEAPAAAVPARAGMGVADVDGRFTLVITDTLAGALPLRYRLAVRAAVAGGPAATAEGAFLVSPAPAAVGVRLPSRIFAVRRPGNVELLALAPDGRPLADAPLRVDVYRRTWERVAAHGASGAPQPAWLPRDRLTSRRAARTGANGTVSLALALPSGGAYRLRVSGADRAPSLPSSAVTLWATAPGFTAWGELPGDRPLLIADRSAYRPGETATLLVPLPSAQATALVTWGEAGRIMGGVRLLRAGAPFTLTVPPDAVADVPVTVLLSRRAASPAGVLEPPLLATTVLPLDSQARRLIVSIATDRDSYAPGATATLTVTTTDTAGAGVSADVVLDVVGASAAPTTEIAPAFRSPPPALTVAPKPAAARAVRARLAAENGGPQLPAPGVYWNAARRTGSSGVLTLTVRLPEAPIDLRALAWAANLDRFGQAQAALAVTQTLALALQAPPGFRAGDEIAIVARVQNTSPISRAVELHVAVAGIQVQPGTPVRQQLVLAPGASARLVWPAAVRPDPIVRLSVRLLADGEPAQVAQVAQSILPSAPPQAPRESGIALLREYLDPLTGRPLDPAQLREGQIVRARLTAVVLMRSRAVTVDEPLPAGAALIEADAGGDFARAATAAGRLTLTRGASAPGIYQHTYLLRMVAAGRYHVPAPTGQAPERLAGVGNALTIEVAAR